jgi:membrane protease YdiL (CAAX protease family)
MPAAFPWFFLLLWFCITVLASFIVNSLTAESSDDRQVFVQAVVQAVINTAFGIGALIAARGYFARRLKGFGINFKKIPADFLFALGYLFAVLPVVFASLQATLLVGRLIYGGDYQIAQHEEIQLVRSYTQPAIRTAILVSGAIITPFFEEVLFRGLIQSTIRSYVLRPWLAIVISSVIFAAVHPSAHWAAVFVLGMLLGYAYEKSGSLFRPMFIHCLFNGLTILAAISQA